MTQTPAAKTALLFVVAIALVVGLSAAGYSHHRTAEKARLLADIQRTEIPAAGYAMETGAFSSTPADPAWRAYCEHERVTLIDEARAAAGVQSHGE